MKKFARTFPVCALARWDTDNPGNAIRSLFDRWVLPGQHGRGESMLRIGIRDGYLNFYVKGQSVAKLSCGSGGPTIEVHKKYFDGQKRSKKADDSLGSGNVSVGAVELANAGTGKLISRWIATAISYASAEKRFVDELISYNPGVIDLEMGLPAGGVDGEKTAPRMDLVLVQTTTSDIGHIAFWEAKCSNNSELRADADYKETAAGGYDSGPKIIHQLRKYQRWVGQQHRMTEVQGAFKHVATILLDLAKTFGKFDAPCLPIWSVLASTPEPKVILPPGVVIGNYCPEGHVPSKSGANVFVQRARSFGCHREKLLRHGITVHEVGPDHSDPQLPSLSAGYVVADR